MAEWGPHIEITTPEGKPRRGLAEVGDLFSSGDVHHIIVAVEDICMPTHPHPHPPKLPPSSIRTF